MSISAFDAKNHDRIAALGRRVLEGREISREEGLWLFKLANAADI